MKNPTRRNRNIGTSKQGYGQDNKLVVPYPALEMKSFYERLSSYKTVVKEINGHSFTFIIEKTRDNSFHSCTVEDLANVLVHIPKQDYGELELIILRQPTRKEETLHPVWGRLIYSYEFEDDYYPAIIIESFDFEKSFKWTKKLSMAAQRELERLKDDGHKIIMGKKFFEAKYELEAVRATQLYRTFLHEFGHYVHYLKVVEQPGADNEDLEEWNKRLDHYHNIPSPDKEVFAHSYADKLKKELEKKAVIPFPRIVDKQEMITNGLSLNDFIK